QAVAQLGGGVDSGREQAELTKPVIPRSKAEPAQSVGLANGRNPFIGVTLSKGIPRQRFWLTFCQVD
ncbi:MAG TPA: hypothetical protein VF982_11655, partial [Anaerolineales bacterium]